MRDSQNISYHVAAGNIDKELLKEFITAVLQKTDDDEALKLKILSALSGQAA